MENKKIFIDFDGVILDSEERILKQKLSSNLDWDDFFQTVDWFQLLSTSKIINDSVNYILEKQKSYKNLAILTKIHTVNEMLAKTEYIRNKQIEIPIFFVPPRTTKSEIYHPKNGEILIDDSLKNLKDWKLHGGTGIYFSLSHQSQEFKTIKSLKKYYRKGSFFI